MANIANLEADANTLGMNGEAATLGMNGVAAQNDNEPMRRHRTRRQRRHDRRSKRSEGSRLMKSWERKLAVHARKEALRGARNLIPA